MADYNARFGKPPRLDKDLHRPLAPQDDLDSSFAWRVQRTVIVADWTALTGGPLNRSRQ
jgi:hypothetical protein